MSLSKEKICLFITALICVIGCSVLSVYNWIEAAYSKAEVIPPWDYSEGIMPDEVTESKPATTDMTGTININTATVEQLADFLPGIGTVKAKAIVEYRELAGEFVSVDELIKVDGIGEKTLENIRPYCRISD